MSDVRLKSSEEIERLAAIGIVASEVLSLLLDMVAPGVTSAEIDRKADELIAERGYRPTFKDVPNYNHATCINVNDVVAHGVPSGYCFAEGDLVGIDVALTSPEGLVVDTAWTVLIGESYDEAGRLLRGGEKALRCGLEECALGKTTGDIAWAIEKSARRYQLSPVQFLSGHGTGYELHEDPPVPNEGSAGSGRNLEAGLVLAIEPMLTTGGGKITTLDDDWSIVTRDGRLSSLFEVTIALCEDGMRLLTPPPRPWGA